MYGVSDAGLDASCFHGNQRLRDVCKISYTCLMHMYTCAYEFKGGADSVTVVSTLLTTFLDSSAVLFLLLPLLEPLTPNICLVLLV